MVHQSVLSALQLAAEQDPNNTELKLHLSDLLLQAGQAAAALEQAKAALSSEPDNVRALKLAAWAADEMGQTDTAARYHHLHDALTGVIQGAAPLPKPVLAVTDHAELVEHEPDGETSDQRWDLQTPRVTLADVAGMEDVKRRLELSLLAPLKNPELLKMYGSALRGGLLLYGPPGCGKTFIARAVAGELSAKFINVGLSDVLDMYMGQSERNLSEVFALARRRAPCVLFLDEVDALGRRRSQMRHSAANVVGQLLSELDGAKASNEGVFVLAATNSPWDVDPALRRPGRFDRTLLVLPPDLEARRHLLELETCSRPTEALDLPALAAKTADFSGADLTHLVASATELAMEDAIKSGKVRPIRQADFIRALREVRPSTKTWFETAKNAAQFANDDGEYDDLLSYLRGKSGGR
ncbi:ATP-binding protein [Deinococcus psychrotolerans]|uniref:ATP-binding protein n=1 Tax=Deinococcus psychrotolerans TaxID=2489213 RepID=A0A3G8YI56_9DEIO|nr:ATP-binding protein [Deinococcus psychrotolerans]AZI42184.1 ATP-binding protein [Deinococcus psychrotolerans]